MSEDLPLIEPLNDPELESLTDISFGVTKEKSTASATVDIEGELHEFDNVHIVDIGSTTFVICKDVEIVDENRVLVPRKIVPIDSVRDVTLHNEQFELSDADE